MKKLFLFILAGILLISLASAETQTFGVFKQNNTINLIQTCTNSTYSNITRVIYPNSTFALNGQYDMIKSGDDYYYSFSDTNTLGKYLIYGYCDENGVATNWGYDMLITKNGEMNKGENYDIFLYLLFIVATIGLFYTFFLCLANLVTSEETFYSVLVSWSFFILMIIVNHLADYQLSTFVTDLSNSFITLTPWTNVVLPLLSFIITMFVKSTQKKKPVSVQEIGGFRYG